MDFVRPISRDEGTRSAQPRSDGRLAFGLVICLALAAQVGAGEKVGLLRALGDAVLGPVEYESRAILEIRRNRPIGGEALQPHDPEVAALRRLLRQALGEEFYAARAEEELEDIRIRMLTWTVVRDIVLSRHVDFGRDIDPDDRRQLERVHEEIERSTRISALGTRFVAVACRGPRPEQNASLANELVRSFVNEQRREAQEHAKQDLKYYRDKYASGQARLAEVDAQIREFLQANPWLRSTVAEHHAEYKQAEEQERAIAEEIGQQENALAALRKELAQEPAEATVRRTIQASPELQEAVKRLQEIQALVDEAKNPPDAGLKEARRRLGDALTALKDLGPGKLLVVEERLANPALKDLQERIRLQEREIEKLQQRKLAINKRVNESYVLVRRAPELLAQRRTLDEDREVAKASTDECWRSVRLADRELLLLLTDAYGSRYRVIEYAREDFRPVGRAALPADVPPEPAAAEGKEGPAPPPGPTQIDSFVAGIDVRFSQLDANGLVTTATHVFRELLPENAKAFTVVSNPAEPKKGTVAVYRLRNVGTGEAYDFQGVPVRKIGTAGWVIEPDMGWKQIRDQLQAQMKVSLAAPAIGR